jgi:hypothetical protein
MTKINVTDLDAKLREANIDIDGVALLADGTVRVDFRGEPDAVIAQRAQAIVKAYDQDMVDAAKPKPVTIEDVENAETVGDLKALLLKMLNDKA